MKIRDGFVSNSSSSSFVCDICGENNYGDSENPEEIGFSTLTCGHTICKSKLLKISGKEYIKCVKEYFEGRLKLFEKDKWYYTDTLKFLEKINQVTKKVEASYILRNNTDYTNIWKECPICTNKILLPKDKLNYLLVKLNIDETELTKEIQEKFEFQKDLLNFCENKGKK